MRNIKLSGNFVKGVFRNPVKHLMELFAKIVNGF